MRKRVVIIFIIILIICLIILGYYLYNGRKNLLTDPYKAIPEDACVVIETIDLLSFMNTVAANKGLFGEINEVKNFGNYSLKVRHLADQMNKTGFNRLLSDKSAVISFHPTKEEKLEPLLSMALSNDINYRQLRESFHSSGIKGIIESRLNDDPLIKAPFTVNAQSDTLYAIMTSGLLLCSTSEQLVIKALLQIAGEKDIRDIPEFSKVLMASGKNEDKIFVFFPNLHRLLRDAFTGEKKDMADKISRLAGIAEGDIFINENGIVLSGYTESSDSTDYLYKYKFIEPVELSSYKILPSSTVLFETVIVPEEQSSPEFHKSIPDDIRILASRMNKFKGEEITRSYIDKKGVDVSDNILVIYKLKNRVETERIFLDESGSNNEILYFKPDDQISIPVYKTHFKGLSDIILPGFAPGFEGTYFAFYDNFMITGNSYATITELLYANLLNKTLVNDLIYREFESTLPSRASYFFYCIPSKVTDYVSGFIADSIIDFLISNKSLVKKIQTIGYQFAASNNMLYNSMSVMFKEEPREESTTAWETLLDTVACIKPFFFTNHNTGAKEIFIQDMRNNAYLINAAGRVLWKVPLNERINGSVYMIDYFGNGKYQLLFSGYNFIHLLDRNGNYVERYPVKLRSPATNSLVLFDYDNNLNYRLFIAGEDKKIYSYDKTGSVVKGWNTFSTLSKVRSEISYFRISGKDYIVASDEKSLYFLDRRGRIRVNLKEPVSKASGSALVLNPATKSSVVCSSADGTVQHIYFDGTVKKFNINKFSGDHSFDFFDVDGDGFGEYIFIDKGILYLYDHNRRQLFRKDFDTGKLGGPINFIFSALNRKIGVFDIKNNLIYLIGKDGEPVYGFPLRGASLFSIGKLSDNSSWHLVVGGTDKFLYNYKLDIR